MFSLAGKTALVTGASTGLGRRFAEVLAGAGARVALVARGRERLEQAAEALREKGHEARAFAADVAQAEQVRTLIADVTAVLGPVDVLVNDAGTCVFKDTFEFEPEDWDAVLATNLKGTWLTCQAVLRQMTERGASGSLINISSVFGFRSAKGSDHAYPASKAGVEQLTRSLAIEFAESGIRVNAIAPGWFPTDLNRAFLESDAGRAIVANRVPMKRTGRHEELDGALLYLASDASSFTTGTILRVDGGLATANL
ncbi:MAG: SDR family NAD(P)-dependent oxidoreductase [Gammaproteobacteria bacterium]